MSGGVTAALFELANSMRRGGRLDSALQLAEETGLHYYDAELAAAARRFTNTDRDARLADFDGFRCVGPPPARDPVRTARRARRFRTTRPIRPRRTR